MLMDRFNSIFSQLIPALTKSGMNDKDVEKVRKGLTEKMEKMPDPTIAFIGFTGVGKSSTLNALFNAGQEVSDVTAGTQFAQSFSGEIEPYLGSKGKINVYDMPGLGESISKEAQHIKIYEEIIPKCDVVIWTFHANDRSMAPMQRALLALTNSIGDEFIKHMVIAVNKADTTAPGETAWNTQFNIPSDEQKQNIAKFEDYIRKAVREVLPKWNGSIVTYSAKRRYHLEQLMSAMVRAMPENELWVLNERADVADYIDLIDPEYREFILSMLKKQ